MIEVDKESFDSVVLQSEIPVVVDLWGPKCGPCLALLPQVEELAKEYGTDEFHILGLVFLRE